MAERDKIGDDLATIDGRENNCDDRFCKLGQFQAMPSWLAARVGRIALNQPFTLGVNYWPRRKAMYWWSDFTVGEVREEFALIAGLGLTLVRVFLLNVRGHSPPCAAVRYAPRGRPDGNVSHYIGSCLAVSPYRCSWGYNTAG
jgi:hypothetical protein